MPERWFQERRCMGRAGGANRSFASSIRRSEGREGAMSIVTILIIIILVLLALYLVRRVV